MRPVVDHGMRALRFHEYGGLDVMKLEDDVPAPEPGDGEIQVRVAGCGVNPVDWKIREGMAKYFPATFPQIMSREFSGTVSKLGAGVDDFSVGDEVYGIAPLGTCAEFTVAKAAETGLKPPSMDLVDAATVPLAGMTAWQALFDVADLQNGQRALIHAGAGGVGSYAIQLAKWKGAYVLSTASAGNLHLLRELGADEPIDYRAAPFESVVHEVDMVLESIGGDQMLRSLFTLKKGGILVSITSPEPAEEAAREGKRAAYLRMNANREDLEKIAALIQDLQVRPVIDTVVRFDEAVDAYRESQAGHVRGKIVIRIA